MKFEARTQFEAKEGESFSVEAKQVQKGAASGGHTRLDNSRPACGLKSESG